MMDNLCGEQQDRFEVAVSIAFKCKKMRIRLQTGANNAYVVALPKLYRVIAHFMKTPIHFGVEI